MSKNLPYVRNSSKKKTTDDELDPYKDIELYLEKAQEEIGLTFSRRSDANENGFHHCLDKNKVQLSASFNKETSVKNVQHVPSGIQCINENREDDGLGHLQTILHKLTQGHRSSASNVVNLEGHDGNSRLSEGSQTCHLPYHSSPALSRKQVITTSNKNEEMGNLPSLWQAGPSNASWQNVCNPVQCEKDQNKDNFINANHLQVMSHYIATSAAQDEIDCRSSRLMHHCCKSPTSCRKTCGYSMSAGRKHVTTHASNVKSEMQNYSTFRSDLILTSSKYASSVGSLDIHVLSNWANKLADEMNSFATQNALEKFDGDECFRFRNEPCISTSCSDGNRHDRKCISRVAQLSSEDSVRARKSWEENILSIGADDTLQFQMDADDNDEVFVERFPKHTSTDAKADVEYRYQEPRQKLYVSESHHYVTPRDNSSELYKLPDAQPRFIQEITVDINNRKSTQDASEVENRVTLPEKHQGTIMTDKTEVTDVPCKLGCNPLAAAVISSSLKNRMDRMDWEENELSSVTSAVVDVLEDKSVTVLEKPMDVVFELDTAVATVKSDASSDKIANKRKDDSLTRSRLGSSPSSPLDPDDVRAFIRRVETSILESSEGAATHFDKTTTGDTVSVTPASCDKDFRNTSTQTSPLVSRSSSFLWFSDMDLRDRPLLQQFDAVTGSVNSLLSSCSSLETFSEGSRSGSSCDNSDSSVIDPDDCTQQRVNFLVIREENESSNLDSPDDFRCGKIKLSIHHSKSEILIHENHGEQDDDDDDDACTTSAQIASDSETVSDTKISGNADNQSGCPALGKSLSEISTAKSTISTLSSSSLNDSSSSMQSVRDIHLESIFSDCANKKAQEGELTVKSEPSKSSHMIVSKTASLTPPPKLKPLILRTLSAVSAPSSAASTPVSDLLDAGPVTADIMHDYCNLSLSIFDIASKSSSAPILDLRTPCNAARDSVTLTPSQSSRGKTNINLKVIPPLRSQSVKELAELEAVEACKWLRAAGFPQYAQMFEDLQFPINIAAVQKDHYFLDQDSIHSLYRRLNALNRCARMRLDNIPRKTVEDSDEEEQCALSENWTFQRQSRRWSRISPSLEPTTLSRKSNESPYSKGVDGKFSTINTSPSKDAKKSPKSHELDIPESPIPMDEDGSNGSASIGSLTASDKMEDSTCSENRTFRRTNSERFRDGAKAFLRRMESLKTRRSKRRNREAVVISGPQVLDLDEMQSRVQKLACVDITPPNSATSSPQLIHHSNNSDGRGVTSEDNSSTNSTSDNSQTSTPSTNIRNGHWGLNIHGSNSSEHGAFSDSECSPTMWRAHCDTNSNDNKFIEHYIPIMTDMNLTKGFAPNSNQVNGRTGSFNMGNESQTYKEKFLEKRRIKNNLRLPSDKRQGMYNATSLPVSNTLSVDGGNYVRSLERSNTLDNQTDNKRVAYLQDSDSCSSVSTNQDGDSENQKGGSQTDESPVIKSKSNHQQTNVNLSVRRPSAAFNKQCAILSGNSISIGKLSAAQLMMLRKLSLLKLTALMERYSPSNRSGWSWIMPKFIKRMKAPDYKDKVIFGVPLSVIYQQTGQPLPPSIQAAMMYLRQNAADSVGLFRKSGVRSRIQKLKNMNEANPALLSYEGQQTYDVADMLKQYFRDLPEALFTTKMSETFICIYQYIPEDLRHDAVQASIMLMPDENREVLHVLLNFLNDVAQQKHVNQMNASNLAVCFAPSVFHMSSSRSASSSPRRRKTVGVPDAKELNENKAANECLTYMILEYKRLFAIPEETVYQCCLSVSDVDCVPLENLGHANGSMTGNWQSYVNGAVDEMLKESRDKFKGWVSLATSENAEIAYRKVGDGNPLRQWKVSVEVEAPPIELLTRVLRERHLWDNQVLQWNIVTRLNTQSEILHYNCKSMSPLPSRDYCILRSWKTDLPKGACVLVETSVDHPDAPVEVGDVRGYMLFSRYLIEPCGSGKSRITHISRIDTKGRSQEWYPKIYSHNCAVHLLRICESFRLKTDGPESKV